MCNPITGATLATFLKSSSSQPFMIIDARFDYEFESGHIDGAININSPADLEKIFLQDTERLRDLMRTNSILIFHCEFSERRGPQMFRTLRELDRRINEHRWPQMFFPEMYLLDKGFARFSKDYPEHCVGSYLPQADHNREKNRERSRKHAV